MSENAGVPYNARAKYTKYVRRARTIDHAGKSTAHSLSGNIILLFENFW